MNTNRLIINHFAPEDKKDYFCNISNDKKVLETFMCKYTEVIDELNFEPYLSNKNIFGIRLKETGKIIGIILICSEKDDECEIGYAIGSAYWNNGYATEAVIKFIEYCFKYRKYKKVCASYFVGNECSKRVMEKSGMIYSHIEKNKLVYLDKTRDLIYMSINK